MTLSNIIAQRIKANGPISFHDFMEMALYYPRLGYYTSFREKIGADGDFYTSSNLTSLYGAMIGKQIEEMWYSMGEKEFTIVEYGAGTGMLCNDILGHLKGNRKLYDTLRYCIIEKSISMQVKERAIDCDKVSWYDSIDRIPDVTGCIISNELVDNFAVHKVVMTDELMEVFVDCQNGFKEVLRPASDRVKDYFNALAVSLPRGYCTEVNIEATEWMAEVANALRKGYVITVDYGYQSSELYSPERKDGTLACYHRHQINYDPYINIGHQDITSHVNFSALSHWGQLNGLKCAGYTNQAHFLLGLGIREHFTDQLLSGLHDAYSTYKRTTSIMHNLLSDMGSKFKVLIQKKNVADMELSGLKLATPNSVYALKTPVSYAANHPYEQLQAQSHQDEPIVIR